MENELDDTGCPSTPSCVAIGLILLITGWWLFLHTWRIDGFSLLFFFPQHTRHHERPSLLCPRFTAHMRISLGILESTQMLSTKFQGLPVKQMSQNRNIFPTQRNTWKESGKILVLEIKESYKIFHLSAMQM